METTMNDGRTLDYPGGDDDPRYATTIYALAIIFLMILCFGLLNFLGQHLRSMG
jgi:hypothetical protein